MFMLHQWVSLNLMRRSKLMNSINNYRKCQVRDAIILSDFNAKLGRESHMDNAVDSHARRRRNENGDYLHDLFSKNWYLTSNTFLKHKDSHKTNFEQKRDKFAIYNQIDYILIRQPRKYSMINARSYINNQIDTNRRLVITNLWTKS